MSQGRKISSVLMRQSLCCLQPKHGRTQSHQMSQGRKIFSVLTQLRIEPATLHTKIQLYRIAIKAGLYRKAVQVCYIPIPCNTRLQLLLGANKLFEQTSNIIHNIGKLEKETSHILFGKFYLIYLVRIVKGVGIICTVLSRTCLNAPNCIFFSRGADIFLCYISAVDSTVVPTGGTGEAPGGGPTDCQEPVIPDEKMLGRSFSLSTLG